MIFTFVIRPRGPFQGSRMVQAFFLALVVLVGEVVLPASRLRRSENLEVQGNRDTGHPQAALREIDG